MVSRGAYQGQNKELVDLMISNGADYWAHVLLKVSRGRWLKRTPLAGH